MIDLIKQYWQQYSVGHAGPSDRAGHYSLVVGRVTWPGIYSGRAAGCCQSFAELVALYSCVALCLRHSRDTVVRPTAAHLFRPLQPGCRQVHALPQHLLPGRVQLHDPGLHVKYRRLHDRDFCGCDQSDVVGRNRSGARLWDVRPDSLPMHHPALGIAAGSAGLQQRSHPDAACDDPGSDGDSSGSPEGGSQCLLRLLPAFRRLWNWLPCSIFVSPWHSSGSSEALNGNGSPTCVSFRWTN